MKNQLHFEIFIQAPVKKVWDTMLNDATYRKWTVFFDPSSYYEGNWEKGSKIRFLSQGGDGMFSEIVDNIPHKFISIRHLGFWRDGIADTESEEAKKWENGYENYTFVEKEAGVQLKVDIDMDISPDLQDVKKMFEDMWPKALLKLKELSEDDDDKIKAVREKITVHLWFDKEAREAAEFYTSLFPESSIKNISTINDTPSGSADTVTIELAGQEFNMISAGPYFKFTPAVSLLVACSTKEEVDVLWSKLSEGGSAMMELGSYPFSDWYGWVQDKYGLSWQIMFMGDREIKQKIIPTMMFVGEIAGKAKEAISFYTSVFSKSFGAAQAQSRVGEILEYGKGEEPDKEGTVKHASFTLFGKNFAAMDSAYNHEFGFSEAISFMVHCESQEEIDYYWEKLSAVPEAEQCGWLKDKYGFSWQIVPVEMEEMLQSNDRAKLDKVTAAFLKMKKFDIKELRRVYNG